MQHWDLAPLTSKARRSGPRYQEFHRAPGMSLGLYRLRVGEADEQRPHGEDEFYYVLEGRATFTSGGASRPVEAGELLWVPAGEEHRFERIEADLLLLVGFAPAEGTRKPGA